MNLSELVDMRNALAIEHRNLYIRRINELNEKHENELDNNLGYQFFVACKDDLIGEIVRKFFNTSDYYITVDQLWKRISNFTYENDYDPLLSNEGYKKSVYNYNDSQYAEKFRSSSGKWIDEVYEREKTKVFPETRKELENTFYDENGKKYSSFKPYKDKLNDGKREMNDELSGQVADKGTLQGDHIRPLNKAEVNGRYMKQSFYDKRYEIYSKRDNIQFINDRANNLKRDTDTLIDTIERWENAKSEESRKILQEAGYLDENSNVKQEVKKQLQKNIDKADNSISKDILKHTDYKMVGKDAAKDAAKAIPKIMVGQLVYYTLPPVVYETRRIIKMGVQTIDDFLEKFELATKRTVNYVASNMQNMFKNVAHSSIKKFIKTFFDILINLVKNTIRRILKIVKDVVLALVDSIRILFNKEATKAQKADSILHLMTITIANSLVVVGLELLEKQLGLPSYAMEAFEIIGVILVSNVLTLILNKADLFDVRYGLKVQNMQRLIDEAHISYQLDAIELMKTTNDNTESIIEHVEEELSLLKTSLKNSDLYKDDVFEDLQKINELFDMEIDFEKEWISYLGKETLSCI